MSGLVGDIYRHMAAHEQLAAKVESGRDAAVIKAMVREAIDNQMLNCCQQLIAHYRSGEINHDVIIGKIGEMAGLQILLAFLDTREKMGQSAMERMMPNV